MESSESDYKVVEQWLQMFKEGAFSASCLREFWRVVVSQSCYPQQGHNYQTLNFVAQATSNTLERFLWGSPTVDPGKAWDMLTKSDKPDICGRLILDGEPTCSCRDCRVNSVRILCVDCFRNSEHAKHRYELNISLGNEYCDCGDSEAWRLAACCSLHQCNPGTTPVHKDPETKKREALDRLDRTGTPGMLDRCRIVIEAILKYALELLDSTNNLSLPGDLEIKESGAAIGCLNKSLFATVVSRNVEQLDEYRILGQLIEALQHSLGIGFREAAGLATCIDREGRSIVCCSTFEACNAAKYALERNIKSSQAHLGFKISVLPGPFLAHQEHAQRLLRWLSKLMRICEGFRQILAETVMKPLSPDSQRSLLERVLLSDSQFWEAARSSWRQLLRAGLLMERDPKREFASIFTQLYGQLMKDFIAGDHNYSFSVTSVSDQYFTVPTLAQYLMSHHKGFTTLMRCFLTQVERYKSKDGRFSIVLIHRNLERFQRALYILRDIKLLLTIVPLPEESCRNVMPVEEDSQFGRWNEPLREGFLQGFEKLLTLLACMEGMDPIVREERQSNELDEARETVYNNILVPLLTLIIQWCASDRKILLRAMRAALRKFQGLHPTENQPNAEVSLLGNMQTCFNFDVSAQPVSAHLPLSRLISGLLLALPKHGLSWDCSEMKMESKPSLLQLMEAPLRLQVLIAQVQAENKRRNSYSPINQLYFYQNVRCRTEMYDRDIVLLQLSAALMNSPDSFLLACLHRFNLLGWAASDFDTIEEPFLKQSSASKHSAPEEDSPRQTVCIAEEFLRMLIIITFERFTPGIGQVDEDECLRHEVLHLLCLESQGHAALNRALPEDAYYETGRVADKVAVFKKPQQGASRGLFWLKPEFYAEYNVYHYHYSREDQSRSEGNVRKIRRDRNEENCCPPPVPIPLAPAVRPLVELLNCRITMHIIRQVLHRTGDLLSLSFSEGQLQAVLHLIGMALREKETRQQDKSRPPFEFSVRAQLDFDLLSILESLQTNERIDVHRALFQWTIRKFRSVLAAAQISSVSGGAAALIGNDNRDGGQETAAEAAVWQRKAEMAAARRAAALAEMGARQKSFIEKHAQLYKETETEGSRGSNMAPSLNGLSGSAMHLFESNQRESCLKARNSAPLFSVCIGPEMSTSQTIPDDSYTCIICQEEYRQTNEEPDIGFPAFAQLSTALRWKNDKTAIEEPKPLSWPLVIDGGRRLGTYISTCGHVMHFKCWQQHFDLLLERERRKSYGERQSTKFDVGRGEFLCPMCNGLSNAVLPILPCRSSSGTRFWNADFDINIWLDGLHLITQSIRKVDNPKSEDIELLGTLSPVDLETRLGTDKFQSFTSSLAASFQPKVDSAVKKMASFLLKSVCKTALSANPDAENTQVPAAIAQATAYTILSIESLLAYHNRVPSTGLVAHQENGLRALSRLLMSMESVVASQEAVRNYALHLLRMALSADNPRSILEIDAFGLMAGLLSSLPSLLETQRNSKVGTVPQFNPILAWHVFRLSLLCHVTQIIATTAELTDGMEMNQSSAASYAWKRFLHTCGRPGAEHFTEQWATEKVCRS